MRVAVVVDGKREIVDVDPASGSVELRGKRLPVKIVEDAPERVLLEIDGEQVTVEGWASGWATPQAPVDVDGERRKVQIEVLATDAKSARLNENFGSPRSEPRAAAEAPSPAVAEGIEVTPPMPGKVLELYVHEGDRVSRGQPLLVLEAMKMRNEIVSPSAGRVSRLRVKPGDFVPARRPMMLIAAE